MGTKKANSAASLVRHHQKAYAATKKARAALDEFSVPATCIMVPEFGVTHIFSVSQLDYLAAAYAEKAGFVPGSKTGVDFNERISSYRDTLTRLLELKEDWRVNSGRASLEEAEDKAHLAEEAALDALILELRTGRDVAPIARYFAREHGIQEIWRVRQAMTAIARRVVRR